SRSRGPPRFELAFRCLGRGSLPRRAHVPGGGPSGPQRARAAAAGADASDRSGVRPGLVDRGEDGRALSPRKIPRYIRSDITPARGAAALAASHAPAARSETIPPATRGGVVPNHATTRLSPGGRSN